MSSSMIWIGMDVHKDTVMVAVYADEAKEPEIVQQLPNDTRKLKRFFERLSRRGEIRGCYEASGAGYVLQRAAGSQIRLEPALSRGADSARRATPYLTPALSYQGSVQAGDGVGGVAHSPELQEETGTAPREKPLRRLGFVRAIQSPDSLPRRRLNQNRPEKPSIRRDDPQIVTWRFLQNC